jgi:hypothetical protein
MAAKRRTLSRKIKGNGKFSEELSFPMRAALRGVAAMPLA